MKTEKGACRICNFHAFFPLLLGWMDGFSSNLECILHKNYKHRPGYLCSIDVHFEPQNLVANLASFNIDAKESLDSGYFIFVEMHTYMASEK